MSLRVALFMMAFFDLVSASSFRFEETRSNLTIRTPSETISVKTAQLCRCRCSVMPKCIAVTTLETEREATCKLSYNVSSVSTVAVIFEEGAVTSFKDAKLLAEPDSEEADNESQNFGNETVEENIYVITKAMGYEEAKAECSEYGAVPFIPKNTTEHAMLTLKTYYLLIFFGWYPANDLKHEGSAVTENGTKLVDVPYILNWSVMSLFNGDAKDCIRVMDIFGNVGWVPCSDWATMLCVKTK